MFTISWFKYAVVLNVLCLAFLMVIPILLKFGAYNVNDGLSEKTNIGSNISIFYPTTTQTLYPYSRKITIETLYPIVLTRGYRMNNQNICKNIKHLTCIVIVYSSPRHFEKRDILRKTFLNVTSDAYAPETIRVVYLLGLVTDPALQTMIEKENATHADIVQGYFIDTYHNLTNKGVMGLKWITEHCRNAEFVLKMDDDVVINFPRAFKHLRSLRHKGRRYLACDRVEPNLYPIMRNTSDQWYVHQDTFKRMLRYPYVSCLGPAVFMSTDLVPILVKLASFSPFFWIDDVYMFGILPSKILNVVRFDIDKNVTYNYTKAFECFRKHGHNCPLIVGMPNPMDNTLVPIMWNSINKSLKEKNQQQQRYILYEKLSSKFRTIWTVDYHAKRSINTKNKTSTKLK